MRDMKTKYEKVPGNVTGRFYNDTSCIDCGMCPDMAPQIFARNDDIGLSYVHRQPVTPEEIALARDALESCPTQSIIEDGDEE